MWGNFRKFEEFWEVVKQNEVSLGGSPKIKVTLVPVHDNHIIRIGNKLLWWWLKMRLKCEVPYQYCSDSQLHCCSVQWGLSSLTVWHILEQACFCLIIIPMGLNVWSRYQEVIVVDLLNMKDFDTYEALFITLPVVFIALVILLLIYSHKRRKVSSLSTICDHSSLSQVYHFLSILFFS